MSKGSEELIAARKEEIITACAKFSDRKAGSGCPDVGRAFCSLFWRGQPAG